MEEKRDHQLSEYRATVADNQCDASNSTENEELSDKIEATVEIPVGVLVQKNAIGKPDGNTSPFEDLH